MWLQQKQTNQWVLTPMQFNLLFFYKTPDYSKKTKSKRKATPKLKMTSIMKKTSKTKIKGGQKTFHKFLKISLPKSQFLDRRWILGAKIQFPSIFILWSKVKKQIKGYIHKMTFLKKFHFSLYK